MNNYLFEGEQIHWDVLIYNENGIENLDSIDGWDAVYVTIGHQQGAGNTIEVNCQEVSNIDFESCNARILEEELEWNSELMAFYSCTLTVETPESMYGEYWVTVEARNIEGYAATMDENEYWWFNPEISLTINDSITFEDLAPGKTVYSNYITVKNSVDVESGVRLDMFISGTDFYSSQSGSYCPENNRLGLERFKYYAENGVYNTTNTNNSDWEGFRPINYGIGFNNPFLFYQGYEIIPKDPYVPGYVGELDNWDYLPYYHANELEEGEEMTLRFKLNVPRECQGIFSEGHMFFWGEAI